MKKTLLVGIDAACWDYVHPLLEVGKLPTLQSLMATGSWGTLASTMPALTPAAWSSIITGKTPGKHGIFDMTWRTPRSYDFSPANANHRRGAPFWAYLNQRGVRVGLVNIPFTYPTQTIDGFWVGGFGTPNSVRDIAFPEKLRAQLTANFPEFQPTVDAKILQTGTPDEIFAAERAHQALQTRIACELAVQEQVDVLVINLMLLDHANHKMPDMARVQQAIIESDKDLAQLRAVFQPDNTMVISDHGSRRVKGDFLLHVWLRDHGLVVQFPRTPSERSAAENWVLKQWLSQKTNVSGAMEKVMRTGLRALLRVLPHSRRMKFWETVEAEIPFAQTHVRFSEEIDYSHSKAFLGVSYSGVLYLNVAGREPEGIILPEEFEETRREIMDALAAITDPETGKPVFSGVFTPQELFGEHVPDNAPDIILDGYGSDWNILGTYRRGAFAGRVYHKYFADNRHDFGFHTRDGICVFAGKDFLSGNETARGSVMDIPATLLHLYGVPIPDDFDGTVLTDAFRPNFLATHPVRSQPALTDFAPAPADEIYSEAEADELVAHLRALGYME